MPSLELFLRVFEIAAVVFAALSGIVDARRKNTDVVGAYFVGLATAFGGGTVRDVLLDQRPLFWVARPEYTIIVLCLAAAYLYAPRTLRPLRGRSTQRLANALDAVALGMFAALGTEAALRAATPPFVAVLFGVITGTFGGVLRDILLNEVPTLFRPVGHLYATAAFGGGLVQIALAAGGANAQVTLLAGAVGTIAVRGASVLFDWRLPPPRPMVDDG